MKRSNRKDDDILKTFSDDNMAMDATFKSKLKKDMLKYDAKLSKGKTAKRPTRAGRRFSWPKLVLAPAAIFAIAAVVAVSVFTGGDVSRPLQPRKVSAEEVIQRSQAYYKEFKPSNYAFQIYRTTTTYGPKYECSKDWSDSTDASRHDEVYVYAPPGSRVEASYMKFQVDGEPDKVYSYYNRNADALHKQTQDRSFNLPFANKYYSYNGVPTYLISDVSGKRIDADNLKTEKLDGRDVYVFYLSRNPASGLSPGRCVNEISKVVFDAKNYNNLLFEIYDGPVGPENLSVSTRADDSFMNVDEQTALETMAKAGFDKDTAPSEMTAGGD